MSKYDFTSLIDRRGKDATAVDKIGEHVWGMEPGSAKAGFDEIPMWVADMNFATAPAVTEALTERIRHPLYGYFVPRDSYYRSIIDWQTRQNGYRNLHREEIAYENGVHGGICSVISEFTEPGETILMHSPAYVGFIGDVKQWGRKISYSPLIRDAEGIWRMDYADMERRIKEEHIRLMIFCSPHNPSGRVWEKEEISRMMEIMKKHDCLVISDEIWSDIVFAGYQHVPTALVSEDAAQRTVAFYAPSKTFNLAGLIGSYHIVKNENIREKLRRYEEKLHYNDMNVLSMHALLGAYSEEGLDWKNALCEMLEENCRYAVNFIRDRFEGCEAAMPQGTYMVFMDCTEFCEKTGRSLDDVLQAGWDVGVAYQDGRKFASACSIRMNCALPKERLVEAFERLQKYVFL